MEIELAGAGVALEGDENPIAEAALAALLANGGHLCDDRKRADILLVSCRLLPDAGATWPSARSCTRRRQAAAAMAARGNGRIVFLLSAIAGMPMRRHPDFSAGNAGLVAGMRTLAMEFGPKVLVNAVGFGLIGEGDNRFRRRGAAQPRPARPAGHGRGSGRGGAVPLRSR